LKTILISPVEAHSLESENLPTQDLLSLITFPEKLPMEPQDPVDRELKKAALLRCKTAILLKIQAF